MWKKLQDEISVAILCSSSLLRKRSISWWRVALKAN